MNFTKVEPRMNTFYMHVVKEQVHLP